MASNRTYYTIDEVTRSTYPKLPPITSSDSDQSQKLRSLHQQHNPSNKTYTSDETSLTLPTPLPPPKPLHRNRITMEDDHYDKLNNPHSKTPLLRRNGTQFHTTLSSMSRKPISRRNLLRLQPALFNRFKKEYTKTAPPIVLARNIDRRNEFFTLKRYIFMTLGMPNTPTVTSRFQTFSTCFAIPFYVLLYMWGIGMFVMALQSDGWLWSGVCPEIVPAKLLTMMAGLFYVLLGLYWLLVLWWSRPTRTTVPLHLRNFSTMALLWWTLCMYFVAVAAALAMQVLEYKHLIVTLGEEIEINDNTTQLRGAMVECDNGDLLEVPNNMAPLWALCSMLFLWVLYLLIFIVATITIYTA